MNRETPIRAIGEGAARRADSELIHYLVEDIREIRSEIRVREAHFDNRMDHIELKVESCIGKGSYWSGVALIISVMIGLATLILDRLP